MYYKTKRGNSVCLREDISPALVDELCGLPSGHSDCCDLHLRGSRVRWRAGRVPGNSVAHRHGGRHSQVRCCHSACQGSYFESH